MSTATVPTQHAYMRDAIVQCNAEGVYDPHEIANQVIDDIPEADFFEFARSGLADALTKIIHRERVKRRIPPESFKHAVEIREWCVNGRWKPLVHLTQADVQWLVNYYDDLGRANLRSRDKFAVLLKVMVKHNAQTVADLPPRVDPSDYVANMP